MYWTNNLEIDAIKWEVINGADVSVFCKPHEGEVLEDQRLAILCDPVVVITPGYFILKFDDGLFYQMNPVLFNRLFREQDSPDHDHESRIRALEEKFASRSY